MRRAALAPPPTPSVLGGLNSDLVIVPVSLLYAKWA